MQFTRHTDYALRLLLHLAEAGEERVSIAMVAQAQGISQTHLMKIANSLTHAGLIEATRGRGGGIRMAKRPEEINLGAVIRALESNCGLVNCAGCRLVRRCGLPGVLNQALDAFYGVLSEKTLADIMRRPHPMPAA